MQSINTVVLKMVKVSKLVQRKLIESLSWFLARLNYLIIINIFWTNCH